MNNAVTVKNVTKEYKGFKLDNISLQLPRGCIMGLVGENGAGKTTLIKIICGSLSFTGDVSVMGESRPDMLWNLRQRIGIVPDEVSYPQFFKLKNIEKMLCRCFEQWDREKFFEYAKRFELPENKRFRDFSLGMKKKLAIAAAMSHNAELLVLDEATSGLDPVMRDDFIDILYDFTRDETHSVLFSSHIVSDLEKLCDYIAVIHNGRLLMCEEKDALLDGCRMVRCTNDELNDFDEKDILGIRRTPYGVQAVVRTKAVKNADEAGSVGIEDIFVYMIKGTEK